MANEYKKHRFLYPFKLFFVLGLCLHLNGILIDPPYLRDTFAAPSKRAREIDFVEVSQAKRYPGELIIVQKLHGTWTVGCEKIGAFSQQGHTYWPIAEAIAHEHYTQRRLARSARGAKMQIYPSYSSISLHKLTFS